MQELNKEESIGIVKISDEVVSVITAIAAEEIHGVMEFQHWVSNNITQIFKGKKSNGKAVKVTLEDDRATIDLDLSVEYGINILDVVAQVQENVKKTVEAMTGLVVSSVNVFVQNIYMPKTEETEN